MYDVFEEASEAGELETEKFAVESLELGGLMETDMDSTVVLGLFRHRDTNSIKQPP